MPTARDREPGEIEEATSFARGLRVLLTLADRGEVRADELSTLLDVPLSSVYRYLRTLTEFGFADRRGGRYRLGPRLSIGSGSRVTSQRLVRAADPVLRHLAEETGETAAAVRRVGLSAVWLHVIESQERLRVSLEPGAMTPLHADAPGRVLLAYAPDEVIDEVISGGLGTPSSGKGRDAGREPAAPGPAAWDGASLREELARIRRAGHAVGEDETIAWSCSVAVPLIGADGIVGALAVMGPAVRCDRAWQLRTRRLLDSAAETIVTELDSEMG